MHLVTQIQMTQQVEETLTDLDGGNKDAIQNAVGKLEESMKATVIMLKGLDDKKESQAKLEKADSEGITLEITCM